MFLSAVEQHGLLSTRDDTNVLGCFPLECKRTMATTVVHQLNQTSERANEMLQTSAHVRWAMECIGHSFLLPLNCASDVAVCNGALDIYERWLGVDPDALHPNDTTAISRNHRPQCMSSQVHLRGCFLRLVLIVDCRNNRSSATFAIMYPACFSARRSAGPSARVKKLTKIVYIHT